MKFVNELNTKYESLKFKYQISKTGVTFLDTEVFIKNSKLYTKIQRKKADRQIFLNINFEHPKSLKTRICSKTTHFEYQLQELKERLINQGYNKKSIDQQSSKVKTIDGNELLKEKSK